MQAYGTAEIYLRNRKTGKRRLVQVIKNLEVNQSGDALALMSDPQKDYAIRYVYFEYRNAAPTVPTPDASDDISIYAGLVAPDDYLRVPIIAAPAYDVDPAQEGSFAGNRVTFFATTKAAPTDPGGDIIGEAGGVVLTDGVSIIHSAGLVASTGRKEDDLLFARLNIAPGPVTKQAGYDVDIHWRVRFGPAEPGEPPAVEPSSSSGLLSSSSGELFPNLPADICVEGAGTVQANQLYDKTDTIENGAPVYEGVTDANYTFRYNGVRWVLRYYAADYYLTTNPVAVSAILGQTWSIAGGSAPAPIVLDECTVPVVGSSSSTGSQLPAPPVDNGPVACVAGAGNSDVNGTYAKTATVINGAYTYEYSFGTLWSLEYDGTRWVIRGYGSVAYQQTTPKTREQIFDQAWTEVNQAAPAPTVDDCSVAGSSSSG